MSELEKCKLAKCGSQSKTRNEDKAKLEKDTDALLKKFQSGKLTFEEFSKQAKTLQTEYNTSPASKAHRQCLFEHCKDPLMKSIQCDDHPLCKKMKTLNDYETLQDWINNKVRQHKLDEAYSFHIFEKIIAAKQLLESCQTQKCPKEKKAGKQQEESVKDALKTLRQQWISKKITMEEFQSHMAQLKEKSFSSEITRQLLTCTQSECKDLMKNLLETTLLIPKHQCDAQGDKDKCKLVKSALTILNKPILTVEDYQALLKLLEAAA